jgi:hypothetical protein
MKHLYINNGQLLHNDGEFEVPQEEVRNGKRKETKMQRG